MPVTGSLNLVADPDLAAAGAQLEDRLMRWADGIQVPEFLELIDPLVSRVLAAAFQWVGASEGTIWLANPGSGHLVAAFNTGPQASDLIGFEQPLDQGIVSLVYANEQAYCENEIAGRETHDTTLDRKLGKETAALLAVPFYFAFGLRGVISCVQLRDADGPPAAGFDSRHVEELASTATLAERLINSRLLLASLGLDHV
ncbi:MAG: hypothetical protein KDN19_01365 [Verrucomicrobiae bacterium]|nr:hypothetical protein [Verrucomicrobiae bacterium]